MLPPAAGIASGNDTLPSFAFSGVKPWNGKPYLCSEAMGGGGYVLWSLRLPRIVLALLVGAALGLSGALIVRPTRGAGYAYDGSGSDGSKFNPDHEYLMHLSEIDPDVHQWAEDHAADAALLSAIRLDPALQLLSAMGIQGLEAGTRRLLLADTSRDLRFIFLKPIDIPTYVEYGAADLGIVGDALKVVPKLIEALKGR